MRKSNIGIILFFSFFFFNSIILNSQTYLEKKEFNRILKLYNEKKYKEAFKGFKSFYSRFPSSYYLPDIYYYLGLLDEDYYTSILIFKELILKFPEYKRVDEVLYRMGKLYFFHNNYSEAIRSFQKLIKEYKKSNYVYGSKYWIGVCQLILGKYNEAISFFKQVLVYKKYDRFYYRALMGLANSYFESKKYWSSIKLLKDSLKKRVPENYKPSIYLGIAKSYLKVKKYSKAYYYYKLIIKKYSGNPEYEIALKEIKFIKSKNLIIDKIIAENPLLKKDFPSKNKKKSNFYTIQISSVKDKRIANDWRIKLKAQGYDTFMESVKINGTKFYRTYVGKFKNKKEAFKIARKIKIKFKIDYIVVKK